MTDGDLRNCDDQQLLSRSRDGEVEAFGELVRRHQNAAIRLATAVAGSRQEAYDIVQDAFVKIHTHLHTYRSRGSVRSWMLRIVANESKNHARSRGRRRRRDHRAATVDRRTVPGADVDAMERLGHDAMLGALGRLRESDRSVLSCRFVVGLDESETADVLGLPRGTVKSRTSRALTRLRSELDPQGASDGD